MNTSRHHHMVPFLGFLAIVTIGFLLCVLSHNKTMRTSKSLRICCTTSIIGEAVHRIGGDHVQVAIIIQPGVDPHSYRIRESDAQKLVSADLVLFHGLHLEGRMACILSKMQNFVPTYAVSDAIDRSALIETSAKNVYDPHVWHDPLLWAKSVAFVRDILIQFDPAHAAEYTARSCDYLNELSQLDQEIRSAINRVRKERRTIVTAHDAFSYYGKAYGLTIIGLQGINTEHELSVHQLQSIRALVLEKSITTLFFEASVSPRAIKALQESVNACGATVDIGAELFSDSLDDPERRAGTYVGMMRHNLHHIVTSMMG